MAPHVSQAEGELSEEERARALQLRAQTAPVTERKHFYKTEVHQVQDRLLACDELGMDGPAVGEDGFDNEKLKDTQNELQKKLTEHFSTTIEAVDVSEVVSETVAAKDEEIGDLKKQLDEALPKSCPRPPFTV